MQGLITEVRPLIRQISTRTVSFRSRLERISLANVSKNDYVKVFGKGRIMAKANDWIAYQDPEDGSLSSTVYTRH